MAKVGKGSSYQEIRGRMGLFGWIWRIALAVWHVAMIAWIVQFVSTVAPMVEAGDAEGAVAAIGGTIGIGFIFAIWVGGTVIIGLFVLLTRRTRAIVPVSQSGKDPS